MSQNNLSPFNHHLATPEVVQIQLDKFTLFPKLAIEVRQTIWGTLFPQKCSNLRDNELLLSGQCATTPETFPLTYYLP